VAFESAVPVVEVEGRGCEAVGYSGASGRRAGRVTDDRGPPLPVRVDCVPGGYLGHPGATSGYCGTAQVQSTANTLLLDTRREIRPDEARREVGHLVAS